MSQPDLFDQAPTMKLKGAGHRRSHLGNIVEELVCRAMGWQRLKIDGTKKFCADAENSDKLPCEVKSVHCSAKMEGKAVIYDWRMKKEEEHAPRMAYAFFCYSATGQGKSKSLEQFLDRLTESAPTIVLVPAWVVHRQAVSECKLCIQKKPKTPQGKRPGYARAGYCEGYRNLPVGAFIRNAAAVELRSFETWGRKFVVSVASYTPDPWSESPRHAIFRELAEKDPSPT